MSIRWILLIALLSLALGSCGDSPQAAVEQPSGQQPNQLENPTETTNVPENPIQSASTPETSTMPIYPASADKFVNLSKKDLADRLKIDLNQVSLIEAVEITWPNSALGCPQPGMVYAAGLVPGYRLRLQANEVEYIYNTDLTGRVILCPDQSEGSGSPSNNLPGATPNPNIGVPIK